MSLRTVRDYTPYVLHARRMQALRRADTRIAARLQRAWAAAREIADFLRRKYQPARIVAFGSIVHPEVFGLHSDIDIAVEGIPWPDYLRAWNDVEERVTEFKVDLIDVAVVGPELRQSIEEEGQPL
ncbi:MAG TPA: nucleotidyltransferase domain-containing protein [Anaerolineae bacterium]|nr:nucleotidyltransferase domain-containing protein [Anaerolineae bacterium]